MITGRIAQALLGARSTRQTAVRVWLSPTDHRALCGEFERQSGVPVRSINSVADNLPVSEDKFNQPSRVILADGRCIKIG